MASVSDPEADSRGRLVGVQRVPWPVSVHETPSLVCECVSETEGCSEACDDVVDDEDDEEAVVVSDWLMLLLLMLVEEEEVEVSGLKTED